jgi:hypothetical protein
METVHFSETLILTCKSTRRHALAQQQQTFQHRSSVNMKCGIVWNHLCWLHFIEGRLTPASYKHVLANELQLHLENVPLKTRRQPWYNSTQHLHISGNQETGAEGQVDQLHGHPAPPTWPQRTSVTGLDEVKGVILLLLEWGDTVSVERSLQWALCTSRTQCATLIKPKIRQKVLQCIKQNTATTINKTYQNIKSVDGVTKPSDMQAYSCCRRPFRKHNFTINI